MTKYQEANSNIINTLVRQIGFEAFNNLYEKDFETLRELLNKEEKYRWHDLRKNPRDLPLLKTVVLIKYLWKDGKTYYALDGLVDEENWEIEDWCSCCNYPVEVLAWRYIEEFEHE